MVSNFISEQWRSESRLHAKISQIHPYDLRHMPDLYCRSIGQSENMRSPMDYDALKASSFVITGASYCRDICAHSYSFLTRLVRGCQNKPQGESWTRTQFDRPHIRNACWRFREMTICINYSGLLPISHLIYIGWINWGEQHAHSHLVWSKRAQVIVCFQPDTHKTGAFKYAQTKTFKVSKQTCSLHIRRQHKHD